MCSVHNYFLIVFRVAHGCARAGVKSGKTCGESNCYGRVFRKQLLCLRYHLHKEVYMGGGGLERHGVRKSAWKHFWSICCDCEIGTIIGHLPWKLSQVCSLFLQQGGTIECTVTGCRKYSADMHGSRWTWRKFLDLRYSFQISHVITQYSSSFLGLNKFTIHGVSCGVCHHWVS